MLFDKCIEVEISSFMQSYLTYFISCQFVAAVPISSLNPCCELLPCNYFEHVFMFCILLYSVRSLSSQKCSFASSFITIKTCKLRQKLFQKGGKEGMLII